MGGVAHGDKIRIISPEWPHLSGEYTVLIVWKYCVTALVDHKRRLFYHEEYEVIGNNGDNCIDVDKHLEDQRDKNLRRAFGFN